MEEGNGEGRPAKFVRARRGQAEVDRVFRYDRLDLLTNFLCENIGEEVEVGIKNVSPERSFPLSEERELREFFRPEYRIYQRASGWRTPYLRRPVLLPRLRSTLRFLSTFSARMRYRLR
jgi:hypothetical protein